MICKLFAVLVIASVLTLLGIAILTSLGVKGL